MEVRKKKGSDSRTNLRDVVESEFINVEHLLWCLTRRNCLRFAFVRYCFLFLWNDALCFVLFTCFLLMRGESNGFFPLGVLWTLYSSPAEATLELAEKSPLSWNINLCNPHSLVCNLEFPKALRMLRWLQPHLGAIPELTHCSSLSLFHLLWVVRVWWW